MNSRIRLETWVAGIVLMIGWSTGAMAQGGASPRDSAVLYVNPPGVSRTETTSDANVNDAVWQRSIASHAHMIAHPSNLYIALTSERSKVRDTKWFARHGSPEAAVVWLQRQFKATPVPGTALIELSIDSEPDRAEVPIIVNEIASHYLERDRHIAAGKLIEQIDLFMNLKTRYDQLGRTLRTELSNLAAILQLDGMGRPGVTGQKEQELQLLIAERIKEAAEAAAAENTLKKVSQDVQQGGTPGAVELQIDNTWEIAALRQKWRSLMDLPNARAETDALERQLEARRAELRKSMTDAYLANLNAQSESRKARVEMLAKQIEHLKQDLAELSGKMAEYLAKRDEEAAYRELSRRYAEQLDRLNVTRQRIDMAQVIFAAKATERAR